MQKIRMQKTGVLGNIGKLSEKISKYQISKVSKEA
jgi:hypothetical protein